jgi:hypothetical protein
MLRITIFSLILICTSCSLGNNPFPKRYLGEYSAKQDSYKVGVNGDAITIPEAELDLKFEYNVLWLTTPKQVIRGSYSVKAKTDQYYTLIVALDNGAVEEWQLHRQGEKKIIRKSIKPQPETIFLKD